jgi:hypothetical protein
VAGLDSPAQRAREVTDSQNPPYSLIEEGLYLGGAIPEPPPGTSAVVNLCGRLDRYEVTECLHAPVFECGRPADLDWLRRVVAFIAAQRQEGRTTYVHCALGTSRSAAAVTAYLMQEHGWGRDVALAFVKERRPRVDPGPVLMGLLAEWERELEPR